MELLWGFLNYRRYLSEAEKNCEEKIYEEDSAEFGINVSPNS